MLCLLCLLCLSCYRYPCFPRFHHSPLSGESSTPTRSTNFNFIRPAAAFPCLSLHHSRGNPLSRLSQQPTSPHPTNPMSSTHPPSRPSSTTVGTFTGTLTGPSTGSTSAASASASSATATQHRSRLSTLPSQKPRQLSHLHAQLAQLTAHVSDLENLLRMTAVQAESMRGLGGYAGGM